MKENTEICILCDVEERTSNWLKEIFDNVLNSLKPVTRKSTLVLTDYRENSTEYIKRKLEMNLGKKVRETKIGHDDTIYERNPIMPWSGTIITDPYFQFFLSISIPAIMKIRPLYERVTAGIAHETAEYRVITEMNDLWNVTDDSIKNTKLCYLYSKAQWVTRDRIADQLVAEHGFERELLSAISGAEEKYRKMFEEYSLSKYAHLELLFTLGYDRGLSLKRAGFYELGEIYTQRLMRQIPSTDLGKKFRDMYLEINHRLLNEPTIDVLTVCEVMSIADNSI